MINILYQPVYTQKEEFMKQTLTKTGIALILTIVFATSALAERTIRVTLQLPEKHSLGQNWLAFKDIVEKESEGSLKVELFPSAQLFKDKQVPEAVGAGTIEAGSAFLGRFAGSVPAVDIINVPFIFNTEDELRAATKTGSEMRQILDDAILKETGAKVLWWQAFGRNVYLSKGEQLIQLPEDLKGKKVRTYGKILGWTVESLGGAPTLMSGSKQFLAYQQGAVDAGMTGASAVKSRKLYEVMDSMTLTFDSAIEFVAIINNDFFNSLTEKEQSIIVEAAKKVELQLRDQIYAEEAEAVKVIGKEIKVVTLTDEQRKQWQQATASVVERFRTENGEMAAAVLEALGK